MNKIEKETYEREVPALRGAFLDARSSRVTASAVPNDEERAQPCRTTPVDGRILGARSRSNR